VKSSSVYATVFILKTYCAEHQSDEPWLVIGFVINKEKGTGATRREFFDYMWDKGFNESLCLMI
jgi:hypothetical protein